MPRSPFRVMRPFTVSFSGGRTSAYMLRRIIDAYGGSLPEDCHVLFANTGKERDETLDFVHEVETRWGVNVRWLEYAGKSIRGDGTFREVDYATAHRTSDDGSPFEILINEMPCLPNPVVRRCTGEMKMRTMRRFLESRGWDGDFHRSTAIGIRADESERAVQIQADCPSYVRPRFPLIDSGVTKKDVMGFWRKQDFDLQLQQHEGNCELCFLKGRRKIVQIIRDRPESAAWWVKMERAKEATATTGSKFREDRSYAALVAQARQSVMFDDFSDDDEIGCACSAGVGDWSDAEKKD